MSARTPLLSAIEQIYSPSFWMNDLHSQLPGSLHQTWPTLITNGSGGQCPIFTADSSVMPAPRVSSFSSIAHSKVTEKNTHLFNIGNGLLWKLASPDFTWTYIDNLLRLSMTVIYLQECYLLLTGAICPSWSTSHYMGSTFNFMH